MNIESEVKMNFRNECHKALVNLYYTNNVIGEEFFNLLKEYGLAAPQYNVLRILYRHKNEALSIGFIKEGMLDKNSDVSRIVDRLYGKGLVDRKENKLDRRQKDVMITKRGTELLNSMSDCEHWEDQYLDSLSQDELKQLNVLLDKIRTK
tara:strand:+ start:62140 stop:62589 length:450 start_codon:yes stop_codon:yes gene_type:complete